MKRSINTQCYIALLLFFTFVPFSQAEIVFNGYASFVAGLTLDDEEVFLADVVGGGVYDSDIAFKPESLFALQAKSDLTQGLTVTTQLVARGSRDFKAEFEWAYLSYVIDDNWTIQAGRKGDVLYTYSDFRDVGLTYNFMRAPTSVYGAPFNAYDGVNVLYSSAWQEKDILLNFYYGNVKSEDPFNSAALGATVEMDIQAFSGAVAELSGDWWKVRGGVHQGELDLSLDGFGLIGEGNNFTYLTVGGGIDYNNLVIEAEVATYEDDKGLNDSIAYFINAGYRMGDWMPVVAYTKFKEDENLSDLGIGLRGPALEYDILEFTLKYDFNPSATLKVSYSTMSDDGEIVFTGDADIVSFSVDLVF